MDVLLDEALQAFGVETGHVAHHVDQPVGLQVPALMRQALERLVLRLDRFELDHGKVAAALEIAHLVEDIGDAAAHAGGEVAPGVAETHHDAPGHVFAAVVAHALDHRDGARIAHREALARDPPEIAFPGDGAV